MCLFLLCKCESILNPLTNTHSHYYNIHSLLLNPYCSQTPAYLSLVSPLPPRILPVRRAAIRPTLRPADVPRLTVEALPIC